MKRSNPNFTVTKAARLAIAFDPAHRDHEAAMAEFFHSYHYPVYAFLRRSGYGHEDAEDHFQGFIARFIDKGTFGKFDPLRGRFRTFLITCLKSFLSDFREKDHAQMRDSRKQVLIDSLAMEERYAVEPTDDRSPEQAFEAALAMDFLKNAVAAYREDLRHDGKLALYEALASRIFDHADAPGYAELSAVLDMPIGTLKSHVHRMKEEFRVLLHERMESLVADPADVRDELLAFQKALSRFENGEISL